MNDKYLFIVWNKAFFCKKKILEDLRASFTIKKAFYIRWSEKNFSKNLRAFYGTKTTDVKEKIRYVGKDIFYAIVVEDPDPLFEERKTYNGSEKVNARIYDKKWLYRKWTGGNFRVHSSQDKKETDHDLVVLLGPDFMRVIDDCGNNDTINTDTKGINGFYSLDDFKKTLRLFSENVVLEDMEKILVISECRTDLECFLDLKRSDTHQYLIRIGDRDYNLHMFGEAEGDLPDGFLKELSSNKTMSEDFVDLEENYLEFLNDRSKISNELLQFMSHYGFTFAFEEKKPFRTETKKSILKRCRDQIKYVFLKLKTSVSEDCQ